MVAPILGPTLGGWITETYSWRWIFYINVPIGLLALVMVTALVRDPAYLERAAGRRPADGLRVDCVGIGLLVLGFACLETVLSKGAAVGLVRRPVRPRASGWPPGRRSASAGWSAWSLWKRDAVIDVRVFADRNFAACSVIIGLCVRRAVRDAHAPARGAPVPHGVRRPERRAGHVPVRAGRPGHAAGGRVAARQAGGRPRG